MVYARIRRFLLRRTHGAAGDRVSSVLGLFGFLFGAVFWVLHLAFRLTVMRRAAEEYAHSASVPPWYQPWIEWSGLLFGIYSVLAYLGIVAYGAALLGTGLTPRWVGWILVVFGLLESESEFELPTKLIWRRGWGASGRAADCVDAVKYSS